MSPSRQPHSWRFDFCLCFRCGCWPASSLRWPPERQQLFRWLCEGLSREEMARRLDVTERTIYRQLLAIRQELLAVLPD